MRQKLGVDFSWSWPYGSASMPNAGVPSLASAKRLPEHLAGGWCQHPSVRTTWCSYLSMLSLCTRWQHPPIISNGEPAQAKVKLIALGYSDCIGVVNSLYLCILKLYVLYHLSTYLKYLILSYFYGGGRLCTCSTILALYLSSNSLKLEQIH